MKRLSFTILLAFISLLAAVAQKTELLPFGDMNSWVTRNIKESHIIGGQQKTIYAIGPEMTINGDIAYKNKGGSPWASSDVMAKVVGITKVSGTVVPEERSKGNMCARLDTKMEHVKAIGIINLDVLVAGTFFLGEMIEPIKSTSDPYTKMEMGIPFAKRPSALVFDYKLNIPAVDMVYSSGFGKKKTIPGHDKAEVLIYLQRRWEDADGNIYAKRVGTGRELLGTSTSGWVNQHKLKVEYGDITKNPGFSSRKGLMQDEKSYYARNSKGKMVPVREVGWDSKSATPTHLIVMFSSGSGEPYTGTPGATFWVDNVGLEYN